MSWIRFFRRSRWDDERAREIEAYLAIESDDNIARGMAPEAARLAARRKFGNATRVREEIYQMNTVGLLDAFWRDLRYGARILRLNPGFAIVAILSLALGIGANAAIFQLIDAIRLRTLPVADAHRLAEVRIIDMAGKRGSTETWRPAVTNPIWERIRGGQQAFSGIFAWGDTTFNLAEGGEARPARGLWVSGQFFTTLGISPAAGRLFSDADDRRGCAQPGAVVSDAFSRRQFGGPRAALGGRVMLDGQPIDVIGVTPPAFFGLEVGRSFDVALPICAEPLMRPSSARLESGTTWWLSIGGRLKPGWSFERASAHLKAISPELFKATLPANYPPVSVGKYLGFTLGAFPAATGVSELARNYGDPLWFLLATAGLVLVIACANLANLMLARGTARGRELAVRLALGASRARVIRQLLSESLLIATMGALLGLGAARALGTVLISMVSTEGDSWLVDLAPDWRVLGFTSALAILTCAVFGLVPALRATRTDPGAAMKAGGRGMTDTRERFSLRRALVVGQLAVSLVLLVGALLFSRTLANLLQVDTGFQTDGVLVASVDLSRATVSPDRRGALWQEIVERLRAIPGVDAAADASIVPVGGYSWSNDVWMAQPGPPQPHHALFDGIGSMFFKTLGTPLVAGRDFDARDTPGSPLVAIVNEAFARTLAKDENPIGRRFWIEKTPSAPERLYEIVGLAKDQKYSDLRQGFEPTVFLPRTQAQHVPGGDNVIVRSSLAPAALTSSITRALFDIDPRIGVEFQMFNTQIRETLMPERLMATLSGFFGALAMLLATVGLYGVMSYMVARRKSEIGIRMALGADRREVVALVMREAGMLLAIGIGVGTALAIGAAQAASALLFGLTPTDPATLALAAGSLAAVAALASYLPARRASRLEPTIALREE